MTGTRGAGRRRAATLAKACVVAAAAVASVIVLARRMARWGTTPAERTRRLPGDDLLAGGRPTVTNAVTIDVPPRQVWPWIVQIGRGRAGFYTYTWFENLLGADIHNLDRIDPDLQKVAVGDRIWLTPEKYLGRIPGQAWRVAAVDEGRALVLQQRPPDNPTPTTWSLVLDSVDGGRTRLLSRHCAVPATTWHARVVAGFWTLSSVMERAMLLGVKARAERSGVR